MLIYIQRKSLWCLLGFLVFSHALSGQDGPVVSRDFTAIVLGEPVRDLYYNSGGQDIEFMAFPGRRTQEIKYIGDPNFQLYTLEVNSEGEQVRNRVGQFTFSGSAQNWLLLIQKKEQRRINIIGYPEGRLDARTAGTCSFLNLMSVPVVGLLGETRFAVKSGEFKYISKPQEISEDSKPVILALREKKSWKKIYSSFWRVKENQRWLILLYEENEGELRVLRIRDVLRDDN